MKFLRALAVAVSAVAVALVLLPGPAMAAATRYAAPAAAGLADCSTPANACDLVTAVNQASQGDEVVVLPGSYTLTSTLTPQPNLSVIGQPGSRPVISMSGAGSLGTFEAINEAQPVVSNLDLESTGSQSPVTAYGSMTVTHVIIDLNGGTATAAVTAEPGSKLADSVVRASGPADPVGVEVLGGPPASPSTTTLLNDTVVTTSANVGVDVKSAAVYLPPPHCEGFVAQASLVNVIARGPSGGLGTSGFSSSSNCPNPPQSMVTVAYSSYDAVRAGNGPVTDGGHNQPSIFTSTATIFRAFPTDLHERPGSPTIDAGSSSGLEATDLDGNPRIIGSAADIGAYETEAAAPTQPPPSAPPPPPTRLSCTVAKQGSRVSRSGVIKVAVLCNQTADVTLTGAVAVRGHRRRGGHSHIRTFKLRGVRVQVTAGDSRAIKVKVRGKALRRLRQGAHESMTLTLAATNANGAVTSTLRFRRLRRPPR